MGPPLRLSSCCAPEYPRMTSVLVMATAHAEVAGRSRLQICWADVLSRPSCMAASVWLARPSTLSVWLARTVSGSSAKRRITTSESVKITPAETRSTAFEPGVTRDQSSMPPDATAKITSTTSNAVERVLRLCSPMFSAPFDVPQTLSRTAPELSCYHAKGWGTNRDCIRTAPRGSAPSQTVERRSTQQAPRSPRARPP